MDVVEVASRSGGVATRAALLRATCRADVDRALTNGALVRVGHGRYALPEVTAAAQLATA